ncbi:hypothetical protein AB4Y42_01595 [Paraburkholderia sp. EG286B]|uniref:hypothetical protein n=1 Tax=Paraburkholderia sp. EG286B TaxID=3237011 RepID=UPI0034D1D475
MKTRKEGPLAAGPMDTSEKRTHRKPRFKSPQALRAWFESRIARELSRCCAFMSEAEWVEHCAWIEENARASLLDALRARADRGAL